MNYQNKIFTVFADIISNNELNSVVTKLFIRGIKLNTSLVFITHLYFKAPKDVRLNPTHYFTVKIPNKKEPQQTTINHLSDIVFEKVMKIYKQCTEKPYSFLVNDTALSLKNPLRFRQNLLEGIYDNHDN